LKSIFTGAGLLACALAYSQAAPAQQLSGEEIRNLVTGNTADVTTFVPQNGKARNYFAADGSGQALNTKGSVVQGKWRITSDNQHCTQWGQRTESCVQVIKQPDGTYNRVRDGVVRATWTKISPGKDF